MADFHDTGALRRIPLAIDWLDPLKGHPAFFPCLRCLPLVSFLNKLHTSQPDCMSVFCPLMDDFVKNTQLFYHHKTWLSLNKHHGMNVDGYATHHC